MKQAELNKQVVNLLHLYGIQEPENGAYHNLSEGLIALIVNDMISKLQEEIKPC